LNGRESKHPYLDIKSNQSLQPTAVHSIHEYKVRLRKDHRRVDLISDALPFGRLWYGEPNAVSNAIGYVQHRSRSHDADSLFTATR
jgi:hypothetical protein